MGIFEDAEHFIKLRDGVLDKSGYTFSHSYADKDKFVFFYKNELLEDIFEINIDAGIEKESLSNLYEVVGKQFYDFIVKNHQDWIEQSKERIESEKPELVQELKKLESLLINGHFNGFGELKFDGDRFTLEIKFEFPDDTMIVNMYFLITELVDDHYNLIEDVIKNVKECIQISKECNEEKSGLFV